MGSTEKFSSWVLQLTCEDKPGIVQAVATWLSERQFNIVDSAQYGDPSSKRFFMRVYFQSTKGEVDPKDISLEKEFRENVASKYNMDFAIEPKRPMRIAILVSKQGHCLK